MAFPIHIHLFLNTSKSKLVLSTVLSANSDSDFMICLQSYQGLIIHRSLVYKPYPHEDRINTQVIYRLALAQVECTN